MPNNDIDLLAGTKRSNIANALLLQALSGKAAYGGAGEAAARALSAGIMGMIEKGEEGKGQDRILSLYENLKGATAAPPMGTPNIPNAAAEAPGAPIQAARVAPSGPGFAMPPTDRVYAEDELNPIDAKVASPQELAAGLGLKPEQMNTVTRTVIGETDGYRPVDKQAAAAVILNRANKAGTSPDYEATKPYQFEPHNTQAGRDRMNRPGEDSPAYQDAARAVFMASQADPTGGATHFYQPELQKKLGRSPPAWDKGNGTDLGPHRFFQMPYGKPPNTQVAGAPPEAPPFNPQIPPDAQLPQGAQEAQMGPRPAQQQPVQMAQAPVDPAQAALERMVREGKTKEERAWAAKTLLPRLLRSPEWDTKVLEDGTAISVRKDDPTKRIITPADAALSDQRIQHESRKTTAVESAKKAVEQDPDIVRRGIDQEARKAGAVTTATEQAKRAVAEPDRKAQAERYGGIVVQDLDRVLEMDAKGGTIFPVSGPAGGAASYVPGTDAFNASKLIDGVKANASFTRLNELRQASPTGGALGAVTKEEHQLLMDSFGSLAQSQNQAQFRDNLKRVKNIYLDTINGKGNGPRETLSFENKEKVPEAAPLQAAPQEGMTATNPKTGEKIMLKGGQWVPVK
jgi:hypothetical protein